MIELVQVPLDTETYDYLKALYLGSKFKCTFEEFIARRLEGEYLQFKKASEFGRKYVLEPGVK